MSLVDDAERAYARAVRALLQGSDAPPLEGELATRPAELEERADAGDDDAAFVLAVQGTWALLPKRVAQAVAAERAAVMLADGSSLSLDDAERQLVRKEERRAHPALRASIDRAAAPFAAAAAASVRYFQNREIEVGGAAATPRARDVLGAFLKETLALRDAAREALTLLGGEPLEAPPALARSLDLPDADGAFAEPTLLALIAAARDAAGPVLKLARLRAPRALAGAVFVDDGARFAAPPAIARWSRFTSTLTAGAAAVVAASADTATGPLRLAHAMASSLVDAPSRRRLGAAKSAAERAARIHAAATVLRVRAAATLALGATAERGTPRPVAPREARELLVDALGSDPGDALTTELLVPPWRVVVDPVADALEAVVAPGLALSLRERFDETFALEPSAWKLVREAGAWQAEGVDAARSWTALLGERL